MTNTFTLIANQTVPVGGASSISFNSISSAYTDLKVVGSVRNNNTITFDDIFCSINGSGTTGSPFSRRILYGNGSGVATATDTYSSAGYASTAGDTSNTFGSFEAYFVNYASNLSKCYMVDSVVESDDFKNIGLKPIPAKLQSIIDGLQDRPTRIPLPDQTNLPPPTSPSQKQDQAAKATTTQQEAAAGALLTPHETPETEFRHGDHGGRGAENH